MSEPSASAKASADKKSPRWTISFLRAFERTGEVRGAAADAGIDWSTAYARRRAHAEFAAAWGEALGAYHGWVAAQEREAIVGVRGSALEGAPSTLLPVLGCPPDTLRASALSRTGEELVIAGSQVKRVNEARWSKAAEGRFFATLADTANVLMAAEAAGFSTTAVYQRRLRRPEFREAWAAAVETGRARLELALIEMANRAIERGVPEVPDEAPRVSISEALMILKLGAEPRVPTDAAGRRRLNAGARGNLHAADNAEIADALAKRLKEFAKRAAIADEGSEVVRPIAETPSRE